jgi:hypothetical protein
MISDVLARVRAVVEGSPFALAETPDPFSFDVAPATTLHRAYRLEARLTGQEGYLGPACLETWELTLWWTQRTQGAPQTAYAAVLADVSSLTAALPADGTASGDYDVADIDDGEVQTTSEDYIVGRLRALVEFDRTL